MKDRNHVAYTLNKFSKFRYLLIVQGILVGVVAGLVSCAYRIAIEKSSVILSFFGDFAKQSFINGALWFILLIISGIFVGKLQKGEPLIGGSGIPQVEGELHGIFDPNWFSIIWKKFLGGFIALCAGLSLGREGPSIQLGAMAAKGISKGTKRGKLEEKLLITCGAGAGLAAAFNAPLAGVLFSLEELHKNFSVEVMLSVMASCVTADFISRNIFGLDPAFTFTNVSVTPLSMLPLMFLLGVILGFFGAFYNLCIKVFQKMYDKLPIKKEFRMVIPFILAGILGFFFPYVLGGGHNLIHDLAVGKFSLTLILLIIIVKFIFSMVSFCSGCPGGIFLPLLVLGGLTGGAFGQFTITYFGFSQALLQNFSILAMAGFFSAIVRAPITGIVLICEMTGTFQNLLAISLISLSSYVVADLLGAQPIYDQLLDKISPAKVPENPSPVKILLEIPVHFGSQAEGQMIKDLDLPKNCLIVAVNRGSKEILPKGGTRLHAGDCVVVLSSEDSAYHVKEGFVAICQSI